jgi:hypothetical protein
VADCCLMLKLSPIISYSRLQVQGLHQTSWLVLLQYTPANRFNHFRRHGRWTPTGPFILDPFPLQRASWSYSYHPLLGTQIVQCTPTPEDHLALLLAIRSWEFKSFEALLPFRRTTWHSFLPFTPGIPACSLPRHRPVLVGPCYLFSWSMSIATTTDYSIDSFGSFTWTIVGSSDSHGLIQFILHVDLLPRTLDS